MTSREARLFIFSCIFTAIRVCLSMAIGTQQAKIIYSVIASIAINMIQLKRSWKISPFGNSAPFALMSL